MFIALVTGSTPLKNVFTGDGKGSEARIIGGQEATPRSFPHHVGLTCTAYFNEAICSGSLITPTFVLTGK